MESESLERVDREIEFKGAKSIIEELYEIDIRKRELHRTSCE